MVWSGSSRLALVGVGLVMVVSLAVMVQAMGQRATHAHRRNDYRPFGVVSSLGIRVCPGETEAIVSLMREAGVAWNREEFTWGTLQWQQGSVMLWRPLPTLIYRDYDQLIAAQVQAGINVLGLLDYGPGWLAHRQQRRPDDAALLEEQPLLYECGQLTDGQPHLASLDAWIDDWGDFVYMTVARYGRERSWIKQWEVWNEPNICGFGAQQGIITAEDFVRLLRVARRAAHAADPEAQIVMGGLATVWDPEPTLYNVNYMDYLEQVIQAGGWDEVDAVAIHPYRPGAPEDALPLKDAYYDLRGELQHLDDLTREYGSKPVWITEPGLASV